MAIRVTDFIDVRQRARDLGLREPGDLVFLPRNFDGASDSKEFLFEDSMPDVRMLLREAGIEATPLVKEKEAPPLIKENDFSWAIPTIFFGLGALSLYQQHPELAKLLVAKIYEHAKKIVFAGVWDRTRLKLELVFETDGTKTSTRIAFDGPVEEFPRIEPFIEKALIGNRQDLLALADRTDSLEAPDSMSALPEGPMEQS